MRAAAENVVPVSVFTDLNFPEEVLISLIRALK
jgi:hypothetical protein